MASFAYHKVFICSAVANGWAEERPSNKPRQSRRRISAIKWKGNVTACIRNLKTSDKRVPLLSSECGCFYYKASWGISQPFQYVSPLKSEV